MTEKDHCSLCHLPFKAAISALPFLTGTAAGVVAGCAGDDCSVGRRIVRAGLAATLTAAGTAGIQALAQQVCQCTEGPCD